MYLHVTFYLKHPVLDKLVTTIKGPIKGDIQQMRSHETSLDFPCSILGAE